MKRINKKIYAQSEKFFFSKFPYCNYDAAGDGVKHKVKNLLKRFVMYSEAGNTAEFVEWTIREEDTPQTMAHRLYGSTHLDWVVLMYAQLHDPDWQWPLRSDDLAEWVDEKYGVGEGISHHHWIATAHPKVPDGTIIDGVSYPANKATVSNMEYEAERNESRRTIRLLPTENLRQLLDEYETVFKG